MSEIQKLKNLNKINEKLPNFNEKDIVVFSLQEIIKLSAMNILRKKKNNEAIVEWISIFSTILGENYVLVCHRALVGILLIVFLKKNHRENI